MAEQLVCTFLAKMTIHVVFIAVFREVYVHVKDHTSGVRRKFQRGFSVQNFSIIIIIICALKRRLHTSQEKKFSAVQKQASQAPERNRVYSHPSFNKSENLIIKCNKQYHLSHKGFPESTETPLCTPLHTQSKPDSQSISCIQ